MVPTIYYFFWIRYHPSKVYSQKKSRLETKYRPHFPPTTKPHPLNLLDRGPTSLVLAGYRLVVLWPLCACSTIFYFCLLLFPHRFYCSKLVLFYSVACLCLISSSISYCVYHFLQFGFSFLHAISCFFLSCFFILVFHAYLFIQKNLGLFGSNNVDQIKRVLGPICLYLPKPLCQRTVFCCRFVICCRSAFCCRLLFLALLSLDLSYSSVFLVGLWALLFIGLSNVWAFGYGFKKWASTLPNTKNTENYRLPLRQTECQSKSFIRRTKFYPPPPKKRVFCR